MVPQNSGERSTENGDAIRRELQRLGVSQARAAKATGQSPALVSMVLRGKIKSQPCLDRLRNLITGANALRDSDPGERSTTHERIRKS
jgi:transcriptional regulator with XRE-family HTH domain